MIQQMLEPHADFIARKAPAPSVFLALVGRHWNAPSGCENRNCWYAVSHADMISASEKFSNLRRCEFVTSCCAGNASMGKTGHNQ